MPSQHHHQNKYTVKNNANDVTINVNNANTITNLMFLEQVNRKLLVQYRAVRILCLLNQRVARNNTQASDEIQINFLALVTSRYFLANTHPPLWGFIRFFIFQISSRLYDNIQSWEIHTQQPYLKTNNFRFVRTSVRLCGFYQFPYVT